MPEQDGDASRRSRLGGWLEGRGLPGRVVRRTPGFGRIPAGLVMSDAAVRGRHVAFAFLLRVARRARDVRRRRSGGAGNGPHVAAPGRRPPLTPRPRPFFFAVSPVGPPSPCGFRSPLSGKRPLAVLVPAISAPSGDLIRVPRRTKNGPRSPPVRSWQPSRRRAKIRSRFRAVRGARRWRAGANAAPSGSIGPGARPPEGSGHRADTVEPAAGLAQLVEQLPCKHQVVSSSLTAGTIPPGPGGDPRVGPASTPAAVPFRRNPPLHRTGDDR